MSKSFRECEDSKEVRHYLLSVLSRTGGLSKGEAKMFHYTNISAFESMIRTNTIWLGSTLRMNDTFEGEMIQSDKGRNKLYYSCFSRSGENLAMYKMYAPSPGGIMISISFLKA